jgi:putative transposase
VNVDLRRHVLEAIDEAVASGARHYRACEVLDLSERRVRRWRITPEDGRTGGYRANKQKLSEEEKDRIRELVNRPDLKDLPLKTVHVTLLDEGVYVASYSTFIRVIKEGGKRNTVAPKKKRRAKRPELKATGPNQVWCWDITWLDTAVAGKYFYLYMIIDMYSRKVVGWSLHTAENGRYARDLFSRTLEAEGARANQIVVHADRGKPMRSRTLRSLFNLLGVVASYSRPHTSNDNAYAESLFATFKNRVSFPEYFVSFEAAESYCEQFFAWYNNHHFHNGLDDVAPSVVHAGQHVDLFAHRNAVLESHRQKHPTRHGGREKRYGLPTTVTLKHRVHLEATAAKSQASMESMKSESKIGKLKSSGEAEVGSAGEQPARNTLTDRSTAEAAYGLPAPSKYSGNHASENSKVRTTRYI